METLFVKPLQERFEIGKEKRGTFTYCGVHVTSKRPHEIVLEQHEYLKGIKQISFSRERAKQARAPVLPEDLATSTCRSRRRCKIKLDLRENALTKQVASVEIRASKRKVVRGRLQIDALTEFRQAQDF